MERCCAFWWGLVRGRGGEGGKYPWTAQGTFSGYVKGGVCGVYVGVDDVDAVFVFEGCVCAFPGCDAAAA